MDETKFVITKEEFENHSHCIRCKKAMPICPETRDGICLICHKEDDEKRKAMERGASFP